jgi:hypothetical protein
MHHTQTFLRDNYNASFIHSLRTICIGNPQQLIAFFMRKRMRRRCPVLKLMAGAVLIRSHFCLKSLPQRKKVL